MGVTERPVGGVHHVTAIASDPQANVDYYTELLGLRLVKRTVNFDDPGTYHLYYGDGTGSPGTILTFFPWPGVHRGRPGTGQVAAAAFAVPAGTLPAWIERLARNGQEFEGPFPRMGETVLAFRDSDGLRLELIEDPVAEPRAPWRDGPVPVDQAIRGLHSVTLAEREVEPTASFLIDGLGFLPAGEEGSRLRFDLPVERSRPGRRVDLLRVRDAATGRVAGGSIHHVAWRAADDAEQLAMRAQLTEGGIEVTPILDRQYFRSIYFPEPGGALFEIATDGPGFDRDEPAEELGSTLRLPPWLEPHRHRIETRLPPLRVRATTSPE